MLGVLKLEHRGTAVGGGRLCCVAAETDPVSALVLCAAGAEMSILLGEDAGGGRCRTRLRPGRTVLIHVATFTRDGIRLRFDPTSPCSQAETEALHERLM